MTIYCYKCRYCGWTGDSTTRAPSIPCGACSYPATRDYSSIGFKADAVKPHFNHAVGAYVNNSRDFDEKLKIRAEESNSYYTRVDPGDIPDPGGDSESAAILETQAKTLHDRGFTNSRGKVLIDDAGSFVPQ